MPAVRPLPTVSTVPAVSNVGNLCTQDLYRFTSISERRLHLGRANKVLPGTGTMSFKICKKNALKRSFDLHTMSQVVALLLQPFAFFSMDHSFLVFQL